MACNKLIEGDAIAEVLARWIPVEKGLGSSLNEYNFFSVVFCGKTILGSLKNQTG